MIDQGRSRRRNHRATTRRPLFVHLGSGVGVDEGGCSPTRARARCACRLARIRPAASTPATPAIAAKQGRGPSLTTLGWPAMRSVAEVATSRGVETRWSRPAFVPRRGCGGPQRFRDRVCPISAARRWLFRHQRRRCFGLPATVPAVGTSSLPLGERCHIRVAIRMTREALTR